MRLGHGVYAASSSFTYGIGVRQGVRALKRLEVRAPWAVRENLPVPGCNGTLYLLAAGCRPDWHAGKRAATLVEAAILAVSQCGFQPRVPKTETVSNCTPGPGRLQFHLDMPDRISYQLAA
jgi:hypothetical protein